MQTDAWLTETSHPDCCSLCSQPLPDGSNICPSCGFTGHEPARKPASPARPGPGKQPNPITPIPARASALRTRSSLANQHAASPGASSEHQDSGWQHDSPTYEVASSLSSLSLIIAETPTAPPRTTRRLPRSTGRLEHIDEIDTVPPPAQAALAQTSDPPGSLSLRFDESEAPNLALILSEARLPVPIDEIDTVPAPTDARSKALVPARSRSREVAVDAASWTAGADSKTSMAAQFVAARSPRRWRHPRHFSPLDRARWWLLRPGHIEFLLWTLGSALLFGITFLLLLATVLSAMPASSPASANLLSSTVTTSPTPVLATSTGSSGLHLTLTSQAALTPGAELRLQGQGFRPHSQVVFLLDGRWPLLNQRGQPASTQADASGHFTVTLWLGQGNAWSAGHHQIFAREAGSSFQVLIPVTITTPSRVNPPAPGNTPAPVHQNPTPRPPTPTPGITPTPTQGITPTPTTGITPTPSPATTPVSPAPTVSSSPAPGQTAGPSDLSNALNNNNGMPLFTRLVQLNPLVWLIGICYFLSMFFLGVAGIMRRRRR